MPARLSQGSVKGDAITRFRPFNVILAAMKPSLLKRIKRLIPMLLKGLLRDSPALIVRSNIQRSVFKVLADSNRSKSPGVTLLSELVAK